MKRRNFMKATAATSTLVAGTSISAMASHLAKPQQSREYYEFREYHLKGGGSKNPMNEYLSKALIPGLNRAGVKHVGAFYAMASPEPPILYVLIPYNSLEHFQEVPGKLASDKEYLKAGESYINLSQERMVYSRLQSSLMLAFSGIPQMVVPEKNERVFELRTYESYNEDAAKRKVAMFNDGELEIFDKTGLNSVFFGETLVGKDMPNLTYMLSFKDIAERDKNWKAFIDHPDWKKMSGDPQYANTVSKIHRVFLEPTDYSQV